eukprot:CAMPEP_0118886958 /NCGR_PEP_ID=MMETSP1163-20130328/24849_1 /TAXON_ID=124430 /ORGANISM="Phaeomonas parva, Strain CCMP2877" /LENGTH=427 /DNA_ID=CAMNT_0006825289 /DNA_START=234 /DNA_END=1513 /DNA_ORIENTATION=+
MWITYAPISDLVAEFYGVPQSVVNLFSVSWSILYLPGSALHTYVMAKRGVRQVVLLGIAGTALGGVLRTLGSLLVDAGTIGTLPGYLMTLLGQALAGLVQPIFVNGSAMIAAIWFGVEERDLATAASSFCSPLGSALGQFIPPMLVSENDDGDVEGMTLLHAVQAGIALVGFVAVLVAFAEAPPTPPSRSTELRHREDRGTMAATDVLRTAWGMLRDQQFQILLWSFGVGLCMFNSLMTLINEYTAVEGYSDNDAGIFGGIFLMMGLVGVIAAGVVMDATHAYRAIFKTAFVLAIGSLLFLIVALRPGQFAWSAVAFGAMGCVMLSLLPIALETAVECTYPASEEISAGMLFSIGNIFTVGCVYFMETLIKLHDDYDSTVFTPVNLALLAFAGVAVLPALFYSGPNRRYEAEQLAGGAAAAADAEAG